MPDMASSVEVLLRDLVLCNSVGDSFHDAGQALVRSEVSVATVHEDKVEQPGLAQALPSPLRAQM